MGKARVTNERVYDIKVTPGWQKDKDFMADDPRHLTLQPQVRFRVSVRMGWVDDLRVIFDASPVAALEACSTTGLELAVLAVQSGHLEVVRYVLGLHARGVAIDVTAKFSKLMPPVSAVDCALASDSAEILLELFPFMLTPFAVTETGSQLLRACLRGDGNRRVLRVFLLERLTLEVAEALFAVPAPFQVWNPLIQLVCAEATPELLQRYVELGGSVLKGVIADYVYIMWACIRLRRHSRADDGGAMLRWLLDQPRPVCVDADLAVTERELETEAIKEPRGWAVNALLDAGILPSPRRALIRALSMGQDEAAVAIARREDVDIETPIEGVLASDAPEESPLGESNVWPLYVFASLKRCPVAAWYLEKTLTDRQRRWTTMRALFVGAAALGAGAREEGGGGAGAATED